MVFYMDIRNVKQFSRRAAPAATVTPEFKETETVKQFSGEVADVMKQFSKTIDLLNKNVASLTNKVSRLETKAFSVQGGQDMGGAVQDATPEIGTLATDGTPPADATPIAAPEGVEYTNVPTPVVESSYSAPKKEEKVVTGGTPRLGVMDMNILLGGK